MKFQCTILTCQKLCWQYKKLFDMHKETFIDLLSHINCGGFFFTLLHKAKIIKLKMDQDT